MKRPWGGQIEPSVDEDLPDYDPKNPLCPGNVRASGQVRERELITYVLFIIYK